MIKNTAKKIYYTALSFLILFLFSDFAYAQYEQINNAFVVYPAKQELRLAPGENIIRNIYITNKLGHDADFVISVEDVSGSKDSNEIIKYYGRGLGPYSIRNYVMVANDRVRVAKGETKVIPVMITLPNKINQRGLYGAVFVTSSAPATTGGNNISTRVGSLIFLKVKGPAEEQGKVARFDIIGGKRMILTNRQVDFQVSFKNTGNIYLNPYGVIEIKNWRGRIVDRLPIEPWYVFPDSSRTRSASWDNVPLFGLYHADLVLNHGYSESYASLSSYSFVVVSLPTLALIFIFLAGVLLIYKWRDKIKKWQI